MDFPLVCICVPCYNAENTIAETLDSILNQTYPNFEVHIFDNASTDQTVKKVSSISDDRIHLHLAETTGTAESNFTRCLNLGRGEYTAIFHSDDLYSAEMVEKEVQFLESDQDAGGVLTFASLINEESQKTRTVFAPSYLNMQPGESAVFGLRHLFKAVLRENNFFFCPSAMIRTKTCLEVLREWRGGMFGPGADLDAWFRIAEAGGLGLINLPLLQYRISKTHFSHSYNLLKTDRADLFSILDYWMKKKEVSSFLDDEDLKWYQRWTIRDHVIRANNALRKNELCLAKEIMGDVNIHLLMKDAMVSLRGLKYFSLSLLTMLKCWLRKK